MRRLARRTRLLRLPRSFAVQVKFLDRRWQTPKALNEFWKLLKQFAFQASLVQWLVIPVGRNRWDACRCETGFAESSRYCVDRERPLRPPPTGATRGRPRRLSAPIP